MRCSFNALSLRVGQLRRLEAQRHVVGALAQQRIDFPPDDRAAFLAESRQHGLENISFQRRLQIFVSRTNRVRDHLRRLYQMLFRSCSLTNVDDFSAFFGAEQINFGQQNDLHSA